MQKKYISNPVLTVIRMHNDVIATSNLSFAGSNSNGGPTSAEVCGRYYWEDDEY